MAIVIPFVKCPEPFEGVMWVPREYRVQVGDTVTFRNLSRDVTMTITFPGCNIFEDNSPIVLDPGGSEDRTVTGGERCQSTVVPTCVTDRAGPIIIPED